MKNYLSLSANKTLKKWGCEIFTEKYFISNGCLCKKDSKTPYLSNQYYAYDLNEIITNGEMAKAFFGDVLTCYDCGEKVGKPMGNGCIQIGTGSCICSRQFENNEPAFEFHSKQLTSWLLNHEKEWAEDYLLGNCVWNPENK